MANCFSPLLLRIKENKFTEGRDWQVPVDVSFRMVLDVIAQVLPSISPLPTSFEYEDEDNDIITVCSDEELDALLSYCQVCAQQNISPICIYPKVSRRRNTLKLEVNTKAVPSSSAISSAGSGDSQLSGHRRPDEQSLINLLSGGQITPHDLHFLEILGHGSGGTVYRAFHTPSKVIMAVKVLALDATPDEQRQIMSELEILHRCDSKFIIGFYGAFFQENRISVCTEYMDGGSLDHYGSIPEVVLGHIIVGVVKGLNYLWNMKIMHRDIKPSNMLVNTQGQVKLCDFGVSVQLMTSLTKTFIGTNAYMAPERILGGEYGIHSEVWSLGVSLLEMSLGRFPYLPERSRTTLMPFDLLQCIVNEKPPSLPPDRFSQELINFSSLCLQKIPRSRPGIESLLTHPFLKLHDHNCEEVISSWVTKAIEHIRVMKRFPSDMSLASNSSSTSTSAWSSHSGRLPAGHMVSSTSGSSLGQRLSLSNLPHSSGVEFMETQ